MNNIKIVMFSNPNSFIKALDACTDFGINVINNTFSATEVMTLTSFHIAQKGLRYTFKVLLIIK